MPPSCEGSTLVQALHRSLDVSPFSTSLISSIGGGYSLFTHRTLVSHSSIEVVRRSQHGPGPFSRIPRRRFVAPASNPREV